MLVSGGVGRVPENRRDSDAETGQRMGSTLKLCPWQPRIFLSNNWYVVYGIFVTIVFLLKTLNILILFQGKSGEAEPFFTRSLAIVEKDQDSVDSGMAAACKILAGLLEVQVRYIEVFVGLIYYCMEIFV